MRGRSNVEATTLDVGDAEALAQAVASSDVVVRSVTHQQCRAWLNLSLLPAPMHVQVANHCIAHGKHLVTASYVSPEMKALSGE